MVVDGEKIQTCSAAFVFANGWLNGLACRPFQRCHRKGSNFFIRAKFAFVYM
jgi:hypothetical protein